MSCSLNLASCRLRAESLARQLHTGLWLPRSPGDSGSVSPCFGLPPASAFLVVERPPQAMDCSPPYTPPGIVPQGGLFDRCKEDNHVWRPDSPPESEAHSESPALTIDTASDSVETVSELASPTYDCSDQEERPLADELRNRLRLIQNSLSESTLLASPQEEDTEEEDTSSTTFSTHLLSPPDCPRLVRSTSLKTGKTPPGTPSRKKIVRFADVLGLDLEAVRHFAKDDEAPVVPPSAFADLRQVAPTPRRTSGFRLEPQFEPPGTHPLFLDRVRRQKVCLEDLVVRGGSTLTGVVRVLNLGFEKSVCVRHTATEWASHQDLAAEYVPGSCDGFSDKFAFVLGDDLPTMTEGSRLHFAVRYVANGQEFWDNNGGENYVVRCVAQSPEEQQQDEGPRWMHHFL